MNAEPGFQERSAILKDYFASWLSTLQGSSCPCAYPRFRAIVAIDCTDYDGVWFCVETEMLIDLLRSTFEIAPADNPGESSSDTWTCKVCGTSFAYDWQEFSINVSCQTLKPLQLSVSDLGPAPRVPMPLFGGIVGHTKPPRAYFVPAEFEEFREYFEEREA